MAFTGQTFSFEAVLTSAEMNQMDTNIDEVRKFHKGTSAPAERTAGVMWINDNSAPWLVQWYDSASTSIPFCQIDPTLNVIRHDSESMVMNHKEPLFYINSAGTTTHLYGQDTFGGSSPDMIATSMFDFAWENEAGGNMMTLVQSKGSTIGQLLMEDGTEAKPAFSFTTDNQNGMYLVGADWIGFSAQGTNRVNMRASQQCLGVTKDTVNIGSIGTTIEWGTRAGQISTTISSNAGLLINRQTNDGKLIIFYKDDAEVGDITTSAGVVSLTGAALSRYSELPGGAASTVPRGTVMAIVNERIGRDRAAGQTLMRTHPSDQPAERGVYGIYDRQDEGGFTVAFSGDFMCRVSGAVAPGDFLESNGDGTARRQSDDIYRASTIARSSELVEVQSKESLIAVQLLIG